MNTQIASGAMLTLLLIGTLAMTFVVQPVKSEPTTWTVDDDGPADFHTIQAAINAASSGDTIIVSEGMYVEGHIEVYKSLTILANGTAIVDGLGDFFVLQITAHQVTISGFTVINGLHTGIFVTSNHNLIQNNRVENITQTGLALFDSHFSVVENNTLLNNGDGMQIGHSTHNMVKKNRAIGKYAGILMYYSRFNSFESNVLSGSVYYGFRISERSLDNSVVENVVIDSNIGIHIFGDSDHNVIYRNNFINNTRHASCSSDSMNAWDDGYPSGGNYWSDQYHGPCADHFSGSGQDIPGSDGIVDTPYVIDTNNQDNYPLMEPWTPPPIIATIDIDPDTLNLRSQGRWVTLYIELPQDLNPEEIDLGSIMLNDTVGIDHDAPTQIGDFDGDGVSDLMVKFNRTELTSYLYNILEVKLDTVALTVSGQLTDATPFEGSDIVRTRLAGDVNEDCVVDITDFSMVGRSYGARVDDEAYEGRLDLTSDGVIDLRDLLLIGINYGATIPE